MAPPSKAELSKELLDQKKLTCIQRIRIQQLCLLNVKYTSTSSIKAIFKLIFSRHNLASRIYIKGTALSTHIIESGREQILILIIIITHEFAFNKLNICSCEVVSGPRLHDFPLLRKYSKDFSVSQLNISGILCRNDTSSFTRGGIHQLTIVHSNCSLVIWCIKSHRDESSIPSCIISLENCT